MCSVSYQIVVSNGYPAPPIYSTLNMVTLRSGISAPVTNLTVTSISDVGVVLFWATPTSLVGAIIGYSVRMNGVQVLTIPLYSRPHPYTPYMAEHTPIWWSTPLYGRAHPYVVDHTPIW